MSLIKRSTPLLSGCIARIVCSCSTSQEQVTDAGSWADSKHQLEVARRIEETSRTQHRPVSAGFSCQMAALGSSSIAMKGLWRQTWGAVPPGVVSTVAALATAGATASSSLASVGSCGVWSSSSWLSYRSRPNSFMGPHRRWTDVLLLTNIGMFALQTIDPSITSKFAKINYLVASGEWYRLLTAAFVHANLIHLLVNCYSLHVLGPELESALGHKRFLAVYLGSAVAGNLVSYYMHPAYSITLGASTAISGLFGALLMFKWMNRHVVPFTSSEIQGFGLVLGINLLITLSAHSIDAW
eukprot:jgi/Chrzof1/7598/Cz02g29200.t1